MQAVLGYYIDSWLYKLPAEYWDTYPARIGAITAEQAQSAARKYLDPGRLQIVADGDATKVADILRKKGDLQMYDVHGKPLAPSAPSRDQSAPLAAISRIAVRKVSISSMVV